MQLRKLVSGGQTGVDRAALDWAFRQGLLIGGWCPRGRWAEDGPLSNRYPLAETLDSDPQQRTAWNVRDSDGTLVLFLNDFDPGTRWTVRCARRLQVPWLTLSLEQPHQPQSLLRWLRKSRVQVLNVAGPRESSQPGIYRQASNFLDRFTIGH